MKSNTQREIGVRHVKNLAQSSWYRHETQMPNGLNGNGEIWFYGKRAAVIAALASWAVLATVALWLWPIPSML